MPHEVPSSGGVTVEVIDKVAQAESETPEIEYPQEKFYESVELLDNGWIKCVADSDNREPELEGESVDYFPPHLINGVFAVDKSISIDE